MKSQTFFPTFRRSFLKAGFVFFCMALALGASVLVHAQNAQSDVSVNLSAKKVVVADGGKETFSSAQQAKPGDVIQYDAVYKNSGKGAVKNLLATVPIPEGLAFLADSAKPADAQASLDGKNFERIPLMREVTKADGTKEKQAVPFSEYRALRWSISELAPGASVTVSARARVFSK